jgi:hypothetical protein
MLCPYCLFLSLSEKRFGEIGVGKVKRAKIKLKGEGKKGAEEKKGETNFDS